MRNLYYIVLLLSFNLFSGCQEKTGPELQGKILLEIKDKVPSKALPEALTSQLTDQFEIKMISIADKRLVFGGSCAIFNSKPQLFKSGEYTIVASYGENPALAMDAPFYTSAEDTVAVLAGKDQKITLVCGVGNSLASFVFTNSDKLDKVLKDYYVEVVVEGQSVKWYPGSSENPYFKAGSEVEFYLKGVWIENNQPYSKKFANVLPAEQGKRYNFRLKFDTSNMTGVILDIQVDTEVENITVNEILPPSWLPKPKITAYGFDEVNQLIYTETGQAQTAVINYTAVRPVQDVEMTLEFADPNLSALNKTYVFSSLDETDRDALLAANVILPVIDGITNEGTINLTAMTPGLLTKAGGVDAENRIKLKVKANDRWSDESSYVIKTVKPVFGIEVYPGNIWTKEFTVNPLSASNVKTGVYEHFTDITYEFSTDGLNWSRLAEDLRKDGLSPGTTYYVRPKYRGEVPGETTQLVTESLFQIPNSDFVDWYKVKGNNSKVTSNNYGEQYEFYLSDETDIWWATKNEETCVDANSIACSKQSRSGSIPDNGSVHIVTMGYGYNWTAATSGSPKMVTPSELFVGTAYNNAGKNIASKPTRVRFKYKYIPYDNDKSDIWVQLIHKDESGSEIIVGNADMQETNNKSDKFYDGELLIDYSNFVDKSKNVNCIKLMFKSGFNTSYYKRSGASRYDQIPYWIGSELYIDDVELVYDK